MSNDYWDDPDWVEKRLDAKYGSIVDEPEKEGIKADELATVVCPLCGETMTIPKEEADDTECWLCGTLCKEEE